MNTPQIIAAPIVHRGEKRISLYFPKDDVLTRQIRQIADCRWSRTHHCWHVPDTLANRETVQQLISAALTIPHGISVRSNLVKPGKTIGKISPANHVAIHQFEQELCLRSYSANTIRTYVSEFSCFLQVLGKVPATALTVDKLRDYLEYCRRTEQLSDHTIHSRINALKFYYEQVLRRERFFIEIPRPKKPIQLPKLLNEAELTRLFNALGNKKHKAILFTVYSAGLRVSEVANLRLNDIDAGRMQIMVRCAKGKKDRYVNLSPLLLDILRQYCRGYVPAPKEYLFESEQTGGPYPVRTIQTIFANAKRKAGIQKDVGIHGLRHSFATHLLDKGTDIRYIKELLGHFNIRTTERYLHVSNHQLVNIVSPLDDLYKRNRLDW